MKILQYWSFSRISLIYYFYGEILLVNLNGAMSLAPKLGIVLATV